MVDRIKALCKEKGITIAELERSCGIGNGIIARWKKSKPSFERVSKVAEKLGVTAEYLLMGEEKPADHVADGLTEEEMEYLRWYREKASERDKALIRMIVKGDS